MNKTDIQVIAGLLSVGIVGLTALGFLPITVAVVAWIISGIMLAIAYEYLGSKAIK
jgi:hypothetical protein